MSKVSYIIRVIVLLLIIAALAFFCILRLMKLQLVDGADYLAQTEKKYVAEQVIKATRGQIVDINGNVMTSNRIVYDVIIQKAFFKPETQQQVIERCIDIFKDNGEEWIDEVPISMTEPFVFENVSENTLDKFKKNIGVNLDATVDNCLNAMCDKYSVSRELYSKEMQRNICGVFYQMQIKDFSYDNYYIFASDISFDTIVQLKEQSHLLNGVDIIEVPERDYVMSSTAPHVLGTIGVISSEEYAELKNSGYTLNDKVGKYGIENAMESVLRGKDGIRTIIRDANGNAVSEEVTEQVMPGNTVKLTIDAGFQDKLQQILNNQINWLRTNSDRGNECDAGAVVVLDVNSGAVLGMASYPSYDLVQSIEDYETVLQIEGNPLYNRSINGLYRPGSAFKTITATAGLITGLIDTETRCTCTGTYTFYSDYQPKCTGYHLGENVVICLKWSCNIFFYDLGRRLGIDALGGFASDFGYGTNLGLEIGGASGRMSSVELYESLRDEPWTPGNTLQAAIGQLDTQVTPLHLAVQAMTLANKGVRYKPYLVDSVWNYNCTDLSYKSEPTVAAVIDDKGTGAFDTVKQGMIAVSENCTWPTYTSLWHFDYLPYSVAIKTGTAETSGDYYTSTVMGYYPAENPQIAFGIVLEKGEYSRYMVRNIIDAYFYDFYEAEYDENGNVANPWKRWENTKMAVR